MKNLEEIEKTEKAEKAEKTGKTKGGCIDSIIISKDNKIRGALNVIMIIIAIYSTFTSTYLYAHFLDLIVLPSDSPKL